MRTIYRAEGIVDAHLVKDALENAGIPAFINGEYLIGGMGQLPARDFMTVSVPEIFVEDAGPVVRDITEMLRAPLATESADTGIPPLHLWPAPA
jgi:Putative prokaryotic signal transducing protein